MRKVFLICVLCLCGLPLFAQQGPWQFSGSGGGGGGGGVGAGASPIMATYFANVCPVANTGQCYYTYANGRYDNTCNWTNTALNCTDGPFTSGVTGMSIIGAASFASDNQGNAGGQLSTTAAITITYVSATSVTLSAFPANNCAANCSIFYGNDDTANFLTLDTAVQALPYCTRVELASSNYFTSKPFFYTNPPACAALGPGLGSLGTTSLPAGGEVIGRGAGATNIVLNANFPNGDACTHKPTGFVSTGGCFAIWLMGKWSDFRIDCGNNPAMPNMAGKVLVSMAVSTLMDFTTTNCGGTNTTMPGFNLGPLSIWYQVNNAGTGGIGAQTDTNANGKIRIINSIIENSSVNALLLQSASGDISCYWCDFALPANGESGADVVRNNGGSLLMFGGYILPSNAPGSTNTAITGYRCGAASNSFFNGVTFTFTTAEGAQGNAIGLTTNGCTLSIGNSNINVTQASSHSFSDGASGATVKLLSSGGNIWTGPFVVGTASQFQLAPTDTISGASAFSPSCTFTSGGGTTPSCAVQAGSTNEKGVIIATTGTGAPGSTGTITLTFLGTFTGGDGSTPACTYTLDNSGTAWGNESVAFASTESTTAPVVAWSNVATAVLTALATSSPYRIAYSCSAK